LLLRDGKISILFVTIKFSRLNLNKGFKIFKFTAKPSQPQ